tara:strand:- start:10 stop:180 length:171 start_codon:yes stop_codon:yes gene_type:complete
MKVKNIYSLIKQIKQDPDKAIKKAEKEIETASKIRNRVKKKRPFGMEYSDRQKYKK